MLSNSKLFVGCRCWNGLERCVCSSCMVLSWSLCVYSSPHMWFLHSSLIAMKVCVSFTFPSVVHLNLIVLLNLILLLNLINCGCSWALNLIICHSSWALKLIRYYSSWLDRLLLLLNFEPQLQLYLTWMLINYYSFWALELWTWLVAPPLELWTSTIVPLEFGCWLIVVFLEFDWLLFWTLNFNCCSF